VESAVRFYAADYPFSPIGTHLGSLFAARLARPGDGNSLCGNRFESRAAGIAEQIGILGPDRANFAGFVEYFANRRELRKLFSSVVAAHTVAVAELGVN
jgi:hypothetical protein